MTDEERINEDRLQGFYKDKITVHITLNRIMPNGKNAWLNGKLLRKATERVWVLLERELGEVRISIGEINSVDEYIQEEQ